MQDILGYPFAMDIRAAARSAPLGPLLLLRVSYNNLGMLLEGGYLSLVMLSRNTLKAMLCGFIGVRTTCPWNDN